MSRNNIVATFARNLNNAANAAKTPLTNIASNIASNISSVVSPNTNTFNALNGSNKLYIWILVIVVIVGAAYLIKKYIDENPGMIESWIAMLRKEQRQGAAADLPPPPITPPQPPAAVHPDTESWCFVGEDLTGRYCVKVPSKSSCEPARTYTSRNECEMVPAQHLPAGIITKQGTGMLPLMK